MRRKWSDEYLPVGSWQIKRQQEDAQYDDDIALCEDIIRRTMSDNMRGYRVCPEKACKRARRCVASSLVCVGICRLPLTAEQEWIAVEHLYSVMTDERAARERGGKRRG
jgi:hypothetical protein